jgi:penicillin-binding protein 1A
VSGFSRTDLVPEGRTTCVALARRLRLPTEMNPWPRISAACSNAAEAHPRAFRSAIIASAVAACLLVVSLAWLIRVIVTPLPDKDAIRGMGVTAQATTLVDLRDRQAFTIYQEQRIDVPLSRVSPHLVRAIIAIEDQRFYDHHGVDLFRVAGAAVTNLRRGRAVQGGSTLTQQLARQSFLTPEKTYTRKLKEVVLARRVEREFSKGEILELYLNRVYFGAGLYGVEAASMGFFGKSAADLDVAEAALLAGLVKSPSTYAPTVDLARATTRRNVVLRAMLDSKVIDRKTYEPAARAAVHLEDALRPAEASGQYFKEEVRRELVERFGWERVYQGGLKVFTTLDLDMQKAAEAEVARSLKEIEERQAKGRARGGKGARGKAAGALRDPLQAALVAMDPHSGEVRALVGGRDFKMSSFNRATQARRQAGSAFKPFVYAAALERGYSPASLLSNLNAPVMTAQGAWAPEDEHLASSTMTMRTALRTSSNRAAVHMLDRVGISTAVEFADRLGVGPVPAVPSLVLGSGEVTLLSMTAAYGAFANGGMLPVPSLIRRVETTAGEVLYESSPTQQRAVSESTAFLMTTMLADVVNNGTAWPARRVGFTLPAAGKTGTTNEYRDAWFVGFTPHLVAGVWVGYDQPRTIIGNGYAGELAVPLWGRFMIAATKGDKPDWFRAPGNVTSATVCRLSGRLATPSCLDVETVDAKGNRSRRSQSYVEHFVSGREPSEYCDLHGGRFGHGVLGALAAVFGGGADRAPEAVPVATDGVVPDVVAPAVVTEITGGTLTEAETPRKRGFWSRVFRKGDDRNKDEKKEPGKNQAAR